MFIINRVRRSTRASENKYHLSTNFLGKIIQSINLKWDWFLVFFLLSSFGLLLVAFAFIIARQGRSSGEFIYWFGLLIIFCPIAARLISKYPKRNERIGLVVLLGLSLYLVKYLHSPIYFTFYDEFLHVGTLKDILQTGLLFEKNSLLLTSPLYPGMEISTSAIISISRSSIFNAGIVLIGMARLLLVLALFLFCEEISGSPKLAGIAVLLYMVNPTFLYFDSQYAYESLAIPLAVFVLYIAVRRTKTSNQVFFWYSLIAVVGIIAVVVTHHVTSYLLVIFLILWNIIAFLRRKSESIIRPGSLALLAAVITLIWIIFLAILTINYLYPFVVGSPQELWNIIIGEAEGRNLFNTWSGELTPIFDQLIGYLSVLLILPILLIGMYKIWKSRSNSITISLALITLAYPFSLIFRFTYWGAEASSRTSASMFIAIAFVLAVGVLTFWLPR